MGKGNGDGRLAADPEDPLKDELPVPTLPAAGASGERPTEVMVTHDRGMIILRFPEPKAWIAMDPNGARNIADAMHAEADFVQRLVTREERLDYAANRLRDMLITRVTLMLTSMERDGKQPAYRAAQIVDQVLSAVQELAAR